MIMGRKRTPVVQVSVVNKKDHAAEVAALVERLKGSGLRHRTKDATVFTLAEAKHDAEQHKDRFGQGRVNIISHRNDDGAEYFLFTNDYCLGTHIAHRKWCHCSMSTHYDIVARPEFPTGRVEGIDDLIRLHYPKAIQITSIEQYADILVRTRSYNSVEMEHHSRDEFNRRSDPNYGRFRNINKDFGKFGSKDSVLTVPGSMDKLKHNDFNENSLEKNLPGLLNENGDMLPYTQTILKVVKVDGAEDII